MSSSHQALLAAFRAADPAKGTGLSADERRLLMERSANAGNATGFGRRSLKSQYRRTWMRGATAVACASAAAIAIVLSGGESGGIKPFAPLSQPPFAAAAVRVAKNNPRLLVGEPGWQVTRADFSSPKLGEMDLRNGDEELNLFWRPAREYRFYVADRQSDSTATPPLHFTLLGVPATRFNDIGTDYDTFVEPRDGLYLEVRGDLGSESRYMQVVQSLRHTSVDTWLSAMPPSAVKPERHNAAVRKMLRDVPLPPTFDMHRTRAHASRVVNDRYQLGAYLTSEVTHGWLQIWLAARRDGENARAERAASAMRTSWHWRVLEQMQPEGSFSRQVRECAHQMVAGTAFRVDPNHQACHPFLRAPNPG